MHSVVVQMYPDGRFNRPECGSIHGIFGQDLGDITPRPGPVQGFRKSVDACTIRREHLDAWLASFRIVSSTAEARAVRSVA